MYDEDIPDIKVEKIKRISWSTNKDRKGRPNFRENASEYFSDFTVSTSLHGLGYLSDRRRTVFERILWLLIISASLSVCVFLIKSIYNKWQLTPVIVSFATSATSIWQIPFPAVTVCSQAKVVRRKFNFAKYYKKYQTGNITDEELMKLGNVALLCDPYLNIEGNLTTVKDAIMFMAEITPSLDYIMPICESRYFGDSCVQYFTTMVTEEGICYTFNALNRNDIYTRETTDFLNQVWFGIKSSGWSLEAGYHDIDDNEAYPRRTMSAGAMGGLSLYLRTWKKDVDYLCTGPVQGYKIVLHHPAEIPRVSMQYFKVGFGQEVMMAIRPDMMTTSDALRNYDPTKRGCFFSTEKKLRFYRNYTQQNCEIECLTNITLKFCDCVAYYMPHQNATVICSSAKLRCVEAAKGMHISDRMNVQHCDCLPSCTTLTYNVETSQSDFNWKSYYEAIIDEPLTNYTGPKVSAVNIFFKEAQFIRSERNELYGLTDFLGNCGGLLSLFVGFSFLSLVEIFYFLSVRLMVNLKRYGKDNWSASEELQVKYGGQLEQISAKF